MLAPAAPLRAAEPGLVVDLSWGISDDAAERTTDALAAAGSRWVRISITWADAEPSPGQFDHGWFSVYDEAIARARSAGQRVLVMVDGAPAWAAGWQERGAPEDVGGAARFFGLLAARYRGQAQAYEVWNEPNTGRFWGGDPDPAAYAELLRAAYPAIKNADPDATVVFGGLSGNDYNFLEAAYRAGAKGSFDVLGLHPYPYCGSSSPDDVRRDRNGRLTRDSFTAFREVRRSMRAAGELKPIWLTEFGWHTSRVECNPAAGTWQGGVGKARQANYLSRAYRLIESYPYLKVAFWYSLRDNFLVDRIPHPEARYGLLKVNFKPRPSFDAFKAYAAKSPSEINLRVEGHRVRGRVRSLGRRAKGVGRRGRVRLQLGAKGQRGRPVRSTFGRSGRFAVALPRLSPSPFRVRAHFEGNSKLRSSRSRWVGSRSR